MFGAGTQAELVYSNELAEREFVAVLDNNAKMHGGRFKSLPVLPPTALHSLEYDQILITTQRVDEVRVQLIEELHVLPDKIALPQRQLSKQLQSFRHQPTAELAALLLSEISTAPELVGVDLMVDLSTLLLLLQQQTLSKYESDLQFSLPYLQLTQLSKLLPAVMERAAPSLEYSMNSMSQPHQEAVALVIEVAPVNAEGRRFSMVFRGRYEYDGMMIDLPSRGLFYVPDNLCQPLQLRAFGTIITKVPEQTEDYLNFIYDDWKTASLSTPQVQYAHRGLVQSFNQNIIWPEKLSGLFSEQEDVSVVTAVYNHEETLAEALDSALLQISPYSMRIYCFNDASTDSSAEILEKYQAIFSDRITVFTNQKNQGSGKRSFLLQRPDIIGRYWGFVAGDDFWLDVQKIYRQAAHLDSEPLAVGCCCDTVLLEQSIQKESLMAAELERWNRFDLLLYREKIKMYTHTSSILWRNIWYEQRGFFLPAEFEKKYAFGDFMLSHMMLLHGGEMHRMNRTMSCYRYTEKGVWSSLTKEKQFLVHQKAKKGVRRAVPLSFKFLLALQPLRRKLHFLKYIIPGPLNER